MTIRAMRREVRQGRWKLEPEITVEAKTEFQKKKLTADVTFARVYLSGSADVRDLVAINRITVEGVSQKIRAGIKYLRASGQLFEAAPASETAAQPPQGSDRGRG